MAILNKHDYDGLMKFKHIINRNLKITELKKEENTTGFSFNLLYFTFKRITYMCN